MCKGTLKYYRLVYALLSFILQRGHRCKLNKPRIRGVKVYRTKLRPTLFLANFYTLKSFKRYVIYFCLFGKPNKVRFLGFLLRLYRLDDRGFSSPSEGEVKLQLVPSL